MRVLYLAPPARDRMPWARYSFLNEEMQSLAAAGVDVVTLPREGVPRGRTLRSLQWRHIPFADLFAPKMLFDAVRLEALAVETASAKRVDLIHSHFGWPKGFGGLLASRALRVPLVASLHGADILVDRTIGYGRGRDPFFARTIGRLLRQADRTVYYSDYMRQEGIRRGAHAASTSVVLWGVDVLAFHAGADRTAMRRRLDLPERPTILAVGGLIARKGVDVVLHALAQVRHEFTFVVCGDGTESASLERLSADLGIADRVVFAGRVDRQLMPEYFAAADIFAHGAIREAAGIVLIEAQASGVPVVCTDAGGPAEYVQDGTTGFVVPVRDPAAMAAKITWLLDHPDRREAFGRAARTRALQFFSRERMVRDVIAVYRLVAAEAEASPLLALWPAQ